MGTGELVVVAEPTKTERSELEGSRDLWGDGERGEAGKESGLEEHGEEGWGGDEEAVV